MKKVKDKNIKWWIGIILCILLFVFIGVLGYKNTSFIIKGIKIDATIAREDGSNLAIVKGQAYKATYLSLNGREIFIDKDGNFSESLVVLPGFSVITLKARDKFGKIAEKKFELVLDEKNKSVALLKNQ